MRSGGKSKRPWAIGLILLAGTLICYWPVGHFSFVNYDDDHYVSRNPMVPPGLSWDGVRWAFRSLDCCNWHPLTWLSHASDCQLWGLNAGAHHATNLGFHAANVLLLLVLLKRMTGALWPSAFVAAVFAWHPMHVESVAWVAERKDVLSTFFFLLTLLAYARYAHSLEPKHRESSLGLATRLSQKGSALSASRIKNQKSKIKNRPCLWYCLTLALFALGLMSKPMLVTLPFVLLLLDYWPLRRFSIESPTAARPGQSSSFKVQGSMFLPLFLEKLPFFALAAASCVVTWVAQTHGGAVAPINEVSFGMRLENAALSYVIYLFKLFWPTGLSVFYPLPPSFPVWAIGAAAALLVVISVLAVWQARSRPWLLVGWFWFIGTLVPVIGLVQLGEQARADRYTYIPYIGLVVALAWSAREWTALNRGQVAAVAGVGGLCLAACLAATRFQLQFWQDSVSLFERALAVTGDSVMVHRSLASALLEKGDLEAAEQHYRRALDLMPNYALGHSDLGVTLAQQGKGVEAEAQLREAIRLSPQLVVAYNNLGQLFTQEKRLDEAAAVLQAGLKLAPRDEPLHCKLGFVWTLKGDFAKAADEFREGVRLAPQDAGAQSMLAKILLKLSATYADAGRLPEAVHAAEEARDRALSCRDDRTAAAATQTLERYSVKR